MNAQTRVLLPFGSILVLLILSAGCQRNSKSPVGENQEASPAADASKNEPRAPVRMGEGDPEDWGSLPFVILKVYPNQKPGDTKPWHTDGGDWTFFDCQTRSPHSANFTVGVHGKWRRGDLVTGGEATILVANRGEGEKFLNSLGTAFKRKAPAKRMPQPLEPWKFNTAMLGDGAKRGPKGGFISQGGSWSTTKWFLERDELSAELFFNYSLQEMKGEFSEKDPDYREDMLDILAIALRDGPRPERTPQTDPNLADMGPRFGKGQLLAEDAGFFLFAPGGKRILFSRKLPNGGTGLFAVAPERPDESQEVARVQKELDGVTVVDPDANQLLIEERIPILVGAISSDDSKRLWWVDRTKNQTRELKGPWQGKNFHLAEKPLSPDGRFVVIRDWRARTDGDRGKYLVMHLLDLQSGATQTIEMVNHSPETVGWVGSGNKLRLVIQKNHRWDNDKKQEWFLCQPETGKYHPIAKSPMAGDDLAHRLSPGGGLEAAVEGKEKLTITDVKTRKVQSFIFHEDDRRFVDEESFEWVSPRYMRLNLNRLAFLDIQTMKMNYPLAHKDNSQGHQFSADFKWVLWQKPDEGLYFSPVIVPTAAP